MASQHSDTGFSARLTHSALGFTKGNPLEYYWGYIGMKEKEMETTIMYIGFRVYRIDVHRQATCAALLRGLRGLRGHVSTRDGVAPSSDISFI